MANGIYVALSGSVARLQEMDTVAHNLANASTTAFKRGVVSFESIRNSDAGQAGADDKEFVQISQTTSNFEAGDLISTGSPFDIALTGPGFLKVQADQGIRLTRAGRLMVGTDHTLRTREGHLVLDDGDGSIHLPPERVPTIESNGRIMSGDLEVGRLGLAVVDQPESMKREGTGLYVPTDDMRAPEHAGEAVVHQGWLEGANVNAVDMMVEMVELQRIHQALSRALTTYSDLDRSVIRLAR